MRKYLITGGAGFIGWALAQALVRHGHRVLLVDIASDTRAAGKAPSIDVLEASITERATYDRLVRFGPFDAVLHLAAQSSVRVSHEEPERDIDTNAKGTMLLAQWCVDTGVRRLLYASSMAVYGEPPEASVSERVPPAPVSNYGVSKLCGEYYIRSQEPRGLGFTILRMFNVYGPGQDLSNVKHGMAGIFLGYVLRNVPVPVTGSLERFRDFVYIDDVLRAWLLALDAPEAIGKTYNVGSGNKTTVRELLDAIIRSCGHDPATYPVLQKDAHAGDQHGVVADPGRIAVDLGWHPEVPLERGLKQMAAHYSER